jgi:hypothetical protein
VSVASLLLFIVVLDFFILGGQRAYLYYFIPVVPIILVLGYITYYILSRYKIVIWVSMLCWFCGFLLLMHSTIITKPSEFLEKIASGRDIFFDQSYKVFLSNNNNKILVLGNECHYYRIFSASPSNRYLYQYPISFLSNKIMNEIKSDFSKNKNKLIFVPINVMGVELVDLVEKLGYMKFVTEYGCFYVNPLLVNDKKLCE